MTMASSDGSRSPPRKAATTRSDLFANKITTNDLLDSHQQLRHEADGLRLQLASKEEVLERLLDMLDQLASAVADGKNTIAAQASELTELRSQLEMAQRREADLKEKLDKAGGEQIATPLSNAAGMQTKQNTVGDHQPPCTAELRLEGETRQQPKSPISSSKKKSNGTKQQQTAKTAHRKSASDLNPSANNSTTTGQQPSTGNRPSSASGGRTKVNLGIFGSSDMDTPPPLPGASKVPMLAPYCKITAAARASERPLSARQSPLPPGGSREPASIS